MLLHQVVDNLVGNALKYHRPDVAPVVAVRAVVDPSGLWRLEVADQGLGVPAVAREGLFDPFTRAHPDIPGTGLGLAICARVVARHGGRMGLDDNPGGGSVFWFTLPSASSAPSRPAPRTASAV